MAFMDEQVTDPNPIRREIGLSYGRVDVLDHGFVRLVDKMGNDLSVVRAARVSYDAEWRAGNNEGSDTRLIRYLWLNKHLTPFEVVEFQFEVKAPIFVIRQWHRHRTWTYNELSARYRPLPEEFYIPEPDKIGTQAEKNKQARDLINALTADDLSERAVEQSMYVDACQEAFGVYKELLKFGWPRELARAVLPVSTYSHMFAKVNLRNLLHFLDLRLDLHAQYEIRVYAEAIVKLVEQVVPRTIDAWRNGETT